METVAKGLGTVTVFGTVPLNSQGMWSWDFMEAFDVQPRFCQVWSPRPLIAFTLLLRHNLHTVKCTNLRWTV